MSVPVAVRRAGSGACLLLVVGLSGCVDAGPAPTAGPNAGAASGATTSASSPAADGGLADLLGSQVLGRAVSQVDRLGVWAAPSTGGAAPRLLDSRTPLGSPRVLLALARQGDWVQVALPVRPNGATGWVRAADVRLEPVPGAVIVDLSARRIRITLAGRPVVDSPVAVGSPQNPTPIGLFFVTDRVRPPDASAGYGGFALGLSGHSDTLSEFRGADGQIGIHGTSDQTDIGAAVSHGCIRVPATVEETLARLPLGTPVLVR